VKLQIMAGGSTGTHAAVQAQLAAPYLALAGSWAGRRHGDGTHHPTSQLSLPGAVLLDK
jgi:hypothetical protein